MSTKPVTGQALASEHLGVHVEPRHLTWYHPAADGVTDDTAKIQELIDSYGGSSSSLGKGRCVIPPGNYLITDTILFNFKRLRVHAHGARFLWGGPAAKPMVRIQNCHQMVIDGLRLHNTTGSNPSAAISFYNISGFNNSYNRLRDIAIGPEESEGTTIAFDNGVIWEGSSNTNNDENAVDGARIRYCTTGFSVSQTQHIDNNIANVHVVGCGTAFYLRAHTRIHNAEINASTTTDFDVASGAVVTAEQITSEGATQLLLIRGTSQFALKGGYWQASASITAGGDFINGVENVAGAQTVSLENWKLTYAGGYAGPTPIISLKSTGGASQKLLRLVNITSSTTAFTEANLDVAPVINGDQRIVEGTVHDGTSMKSFRNVLNKTGRLPSFSRFHTGTLSALADAATVATDASVGDYFTLLATAGRTIGAPTNPSSGQRITYDIKNSSGGAMTTTWNATFKLAGAWTDPANTKRRKIQFTYDDTNWVEDWRSVADI